MPKSTVPFVLAASLALLAATPGCRGKKLGAPGSVDAEEAEAGAPAPVTYRTVPFAEVRGGTAAEGAAVEVEVVVVPTTIVSTSTETLRGATTPTGYYMLALPADAAYVKTLATLRDDTASLGAELAKVKPGKRPPNLDALLERHSALAKRLEEAKVVPAEAVAIELSGFSESKMRLQWDKTIKECTGPGCIPEMPSFDFSKITPIKLDQCSFASDNTQRLLCISTAEQAVDKLAALDPPSLDEALPTLPPMSFVDDQAAVSRFNKLVPRFNKEVDRRNNAIAASLPWKVERIGRIAAVLAGARWTVRGTVKAVPGMAARVYRETMGGTPPRAIVETSGGSSPTFSAATYVKTRYCFASQPAGADILVGGTSAGKTPACLDTLRPGDEAEIQLQLPGRAPATLPREKIRAGVGNLTEIDCVLTKQGSAGTSGCRITY